MRWRPPYARVAIVFAVVVLVWAPFLASSRVDDTSKDWTFRTDYMGYQVHALFHDHELPFWVTLPRFEQLRAKGVHDFFANPETDVLSILTPLARFTSLLTAVKVALVLYLMLGVWGCHRLLVLLGGGAALLPWLVCSLMTLCNGAIVAHLIHGHIQFLPVLTFPLSLALLLESWKATVAPRVRRFRAALAGAMLAVGYYSGATHPLFYFLLCFVVLLPAVTVLLAPRRIREVAPSTVIVGVSFLALSAFKLLPGSLDFGDYHADYFLAYADLHDFLASFVVPWAPVPGNEYRHETSVYVGWVGVAVLALAIFGLFRRSSLALLIVVAGSAGLMSLKPESALMKLPFLRTQGAPTRIRLVLLVAIGAVASAQLQRGLEWFRRRTKRFDWAFLVACLAGLAAYLAVDLSQANVVRHEVLGCKDLPPVSLGQFDAAPELRPRDSRAARVTVGPVTANAFTYEFETRAPGPTLLVAKSVTASGRRPHLAVVGDGELTTDDGALAVRVTAPHGRFTLRFSDPATGLGLGISLVGVLALGALGYLSRRRPATSSS